MGFGTKFRQAMRSFEDESRRMAKYTLAIGGGMYGGVTGAKLGYEIGSSLDDRKPQARQTGTDLGKLRSEATANGFNPLTVLRSTGGQGFYRDQVPMGRLSSDAFFNAFDAYDKNKNSNTVERGRDDIPLTVTAYDPNGVVPDFDVVNPELIESSANEALSSAAMIATQYVAQHGGDYETVLATIQNINQARKENEKDPIRLKNNKISKSIYKQITNAIGNSLDGKLQSFEKIIGYDRNEEILVTPIISQAEVDALHVR
jgi:hypothetical protein